jgi:flagellar biogenesis protein FliO
MEPAGQTDAGERWGDGRTVQDPRKEPALGDPYNWRQMGFAVLIMLLMLAFLVWLIRRHTRRRP